MTTIRDRAIQLLEYRLTLGMTTMEGRGFYYPTDTAIAADGRMCAATVLWKTSRGASASPCATSTASTTGPSALTAYPRASSSGPPPARWTAGTGCMSATSNCTGFRCLTGRARCCPSGASTEPAKVSWTPRRAWPLTVTTTFTSRTPTTAGCRSSQRRAASWRP